MSALLFALLHLSVQEPKPQELTREQIIEQDIKAAVAKLSADDYWQAALAREELLQLGPGVLPPLLDAFRSSPAVKPNENPVDAEKNARVRYWVCELLGDLHATSEDSTKILVRSLEDEGRFGSSRVCTAAAITLGKLGSEKAIEPLLKAFEGPIAKNDRSFKGEVIAALGNLRSKEAEKPIRDALKDDEKTYQEEFEAPHSRMISALAAEALGKIRAKDSVNELCRRVEETKTDPLTGDSLGTFVVHALQRILPDQASKTDDEVKTWAKQIKAKIEKEEFDKERTKKRTATIEKLAQIKGWIAQFKEKNNKYPAVLADLKPFASPSEAFEDGWNKEFLYSTPGTGGEPYDLGTRSDPDDPVGIWSNDKKNDEAQKKTEELLKKVADAIIRYRSDQKRYPDELQHLIVAPPIGSANFPKETYLPEFKEKPEIKDPWGGKLEYAVPGKEGKPFDLSSLGRDRKVGGERYDADVSIWSLGYKPPDEKK